MLEDTGPKRRILPGSLLPKADAGAGAAALDLLKLVDPGWMPAARDQC